MTLPPKTTVERGQEGGQRASLGGLRVTWSTTHKQKVEGGTRTEGLLASLETHSSLDVSVALKRTPPS